MYRLNKYPLWEKARSIPMFEDYGIYHLWNKEGLCQAAYSLFNYIDAGMPVENLNNMYLEYDRVEVAEIYEILKAATVNPFFRDLIGEYGIGYINRLGKILSGKYNPGNHDWEKFSEAPVDDYQGFIFYVQGLGYSSEFEMLSVAIVNEDTESFISWRNSATGLVHTVVTDMVLIDEYLEPIYKAWDKLYNRWSEWMQGKQGSDESGAGCCLMPGGQDNVYSKVFGYLSNRYGMAQAGHRKMQVGKSFHLSSHRLDEFEEYLSTWRGNPEDFLCGTDMDIGFSMDLDLIWHAVQAEQEGKETITAWVITDWTTGEEEEFEMKVAEVLAPERINNLAQAVKKGYDRAIELESRGEIENGEYYQLKGLGLCSKDGNILDSMYAELYTWFINEFLVNRKPTVDSLLASAAGV